MEHILFIMGARRSGCTMARNILCNRLLPRRGEGPHERWEGYVVDGTLEFTTRAAYDLADGRALPATMNNDVKLLVIETSGAMHPSVTSSVARVLGRYPETPITIIHMLPHTSEPIPESILDMDAMREALQGRSVIKNWGRICILEGQQLARRPVPERDDHRDARDVHEKHGVHRGRDEERAQHQKREQARLDGRRLGPPRRGPESREREQRRGHGAHHPHQSREPCDALDAYVEQGREREHRRVPQLKTVWRKVYHARLPRRDQRKEDPVHEPFVHGRPHEGAHRRERPQPHGDVLVPVLLEPAAPVKEHAAERMVHAAGMSDDDDDDEDEEEEDELAKVAGKTAGDWMTLATPDYRGEFWKRKTERDLWVVFGKQYPIELEETLTNFTFAIPRIIDPDTMRPILRKWRMAYALDTTVGVTKYYLPKPRFVAISIRKATRFTSLLLRSCLAAAFVRLVLAYVA